MDIEDLIKNLPKLRRKLRELRDGIGSLRAKQMKRFAGTLGRKLSDRGKEPTYVSKVLPNARPISIPGHPGVLKVGTANNILDQLEQDIFAFEEIRSERK